jgi:hypothetical protein
MYRVEICEWAEGRLYAGISYLKLGDLGKLEIAGYHLSYGCEGK